MSSSLPNDKAQPEAAPPEGGAGSPTPGSRTQTVVSPEATPAPPRRRGRHRRSRKKVDESTQPQPGDLLEGRFRYRLLSRLGRGGFGSVYAAHCLDAGTMPDAPPEKVAVKVLGSQRDTRIASTLKRELSALLSIQDDRIPTVYDWSLDDETSFVVMQYFPSGSLADAWPFLQRGDEQQVWRLIADLLSALSAAHRAGILHLDLKPSNVLLDGDGGFVLTDFGVSQAARMSKGLLHQGQGRRGTGHARLSRTRSRTNLVAARTSTCERISGAWAQLPGRCTRAST